MQRFAAKFLSGLFLVTPSFCFALLGEALGANVAQKGIVIENFEDSTVTLFSYVDQDFDSSAFEITTDITFDSTKYALRLFGNTWKSEEITPRSVDAGDVWRVAAYIQEEGELQAFGVSDSARTLFYTLAGKELPDGDCWVTVYQGAFSKDEWHTYSLPIADDWLDRFGYLPIISAIVYVNDRDTISEGISVFDEILNITEDLPIQPRVEIRDSIGTMTRNSTGKSVVGVHFFGFVFDEDSDTHDFYWDFGDDSTSTLKNPYHEFIVVDDHSYTVRLEVLDPDGLWGRDTCKVNVDPGPSSYPIIMNFVGDIMLARRYEEPGGIIPTYGVEHIFEPTLEIYGEAAVISVCNLECPLTDEGHPHPTKTFVFRGQPTNVTGLAYAGIDVVGLANNHVMDYGARGMEETQAVLTSHGILYSGAGANSYSALQPVFLSKSGMTIAFLSFCSITGRAKNHQPFLDAGFGKPGFGYLSEGNLAASVEYATDLSDLVAVQMHSGREYSSWPTLCHDQPDLEACEIIRFPTSPTTQDRAIRQHAIDLGADVVVCHHPHVLQGFEVYDGRLIAHSLGNFAFDQYYPETYPSVILNSAITEDGFSSFWLTPVFVDDYVPKPATGELGLDILRRISDYSRELGTLVRTIPDSNKAYVVLDTLSIETQVTQCESTVALEHISGHWVSDPISLSEQRSLSSITSITGGSSWEFRIGRDVLWFGNFEDEGASMWNLNSTSEWFEDTLSHSGEQCLCLRRSNTSGDNVVTDLEGRLLCDLQKKYSLCGWIKTEDTKDATIQVEFFAKRFEVPYLSQQDVDTLVCGSTDWSFYHSEVYPPPLSKYMNIRCSNDIPDSAVSYAWFDNVKAVEWEDWETASPPVDISWPNNYDFLQVRSASESESISVCFDETMLISKQFHADEVAGSTFGTAFALLGTLPNPFLRRTTILYQAPVRSKVTLKIYNTVGQLVKTLVDRVENAGSKRVVWNGKNDRGSAVKSGVYFCRLEGSDTRGQRRCADTRKLVLLGKSGP